MKSIKEKSNEYANEQGLRMVYNGSCDNCQQGFAVGTNYVLEQIEDIIVNNEDNTLNMARCLVDCIEQLKK